MNIKYKVKKQAPTTHHIALNEELTLYKTLNEEQKKTIVELEAKAKAFDVLMKNINIHLIDKSLIVYESEENLTQEEYEILKKAGLE